MSHNSNGRVGSERPGEEIARARQRDIRIVPAGDSTLIVEFEQRIDPTVNARAIRLASAIQGAGFAGILDVVPTYCAVAIFVDPRRADTSAVIDWVPAWSGRPFDTAAEPAVQPIRVPVCYGADLGPDLPGVAALSNMSPDEVAAVHAADTYRVFMLGFAPGFAYMGILDARIRAPRRAMPRVRVPRGAVAVADAQTGIYPLETPGGWQIIGRTPIRPYDPTRKEPFLFRPGDAVRFEPIDRREYDALVEGITTHE